jgi:hypothetical protein
MNRIVLLLFFVFLSGFALAQTETGSKNIPSTTQSGDAGKKIGISSASRRSSMPGSVPANSKPGEEMKKTGVDGSKNNSPESGPGNSNRPGARVPKSRPGGPISRPSGAPNNRPATIPGSRPNGPRQRPSGG